MFNPDLAYELLKSRMDRAGLEVPAPLQKSWKSRLREACSYLEGKGVKFDRNEDSIPDNMLIADYAAWKLTNRDNSGAMPTWLRMEIRERFLKGAAKDALL